MSIYREAVAARVQKSALTAPAAVNSDSRNSFGAAEGCRCFTPIRSSDLKNFPAHPGALYSRKRWKSSRDNHARIAFSLCFRITRSDVV